MNLRIDDIAREQGVFAVGEMSYRNRYLKCELNGEVFCFLHIQTHDLIDAAQIHITLVRWNRKVAVAMRHGFEDGVKPMLREMGARRIIGVKQGETERWARLMDYLGFEPPVELPDGSLFIQMEV